MNQRVQPLLVMIHGVSSAGPWYDDLRSVLRPFVTCRGVRYRAYHCFGPLKLFFWPWALLLAMILIVYGMSVPVEFVWLGDARFWFPWLLVLIALAEVVWTRGLTRGMPWFLAAIWSQTCYIGWWNPLVVLHVAMWFVTAWIVWCELEWPQTIENRTRAVISSLGVALLGQVLWLLTVPGGALPLWAALVGQMVMLEWRESRDGAQVTSMWRSAIVVAWPVLGLAPGCSWRIR